MALTFTLLFVPQQLAAAVGDIYTMPASPASTVLKNGRVRLVNTSGSAVAVTLYAVPAGGASGADNCFLPGTSIAAGGVLDVDLPTLAAGGKLRGFADAAGAVTILESGGALWSA